MDQVSKIENKYKKTQPIFEELFKNSDRIILSILKANLDEKYHEYLEGTAQFKRVLIDEQPQEIIISFYDSITISWCGVFFKPEHGSNIKLMDLRELDF